MKAERIAKLVLVLGSFIFTALVIAVAVNAAQIKTAAKQATVYNPTTGHRKAVFVGDPNAFTGGYVLETKLGSFAPSTGYRSKLTSSLTSSATTINVSSTNDINGYPLPCSATNKCYFNIEPGSSRQEPVVCTGVSGNSFTGCTRGLTASESSETGSSTVAYAHNAGSVIIMTNIAQFYGNFVDLWSAQTVGGAKTLSSKWLYDSAVDVNGADDNQTIASKAYVDSVATSGAADASITTKGLVEIATEDEVSTSTYWGGTNARLVVPTNMVGQSSTTVDQKQTVGTSLLIFGNSSFSAIAQSFIAGKSNVTAISFVKQTTLGGATSSVTISLQADSGGVPSGVNLASYYIASTTWDSYTDGQEYKIPLSATLTVGDTYYLVFTASHQGMTTLIGRRVGGSSVNSYIYGDRYVYTSSWAFATVADLFFKIHTSGRVIPVTDSNGKLDQSFLNLTQSYAWTGAHTMASTLGVTGTSTFTGKILSNTNVISLTASTTLTGGTTPQPVYIATTTGAVQLSDANASSTFFAFLGFAVSNASNAETVYVQYDGIVSGFTGLTAGLEYYVQDAAGTIGTSMGTVPIKVGEAISTTQILINKERKIGKAYSMTDNETYQAYADAFVYCNDLPAGNAPCSANIYIDGVQRTAQNGVTGSAVNTCSSTVFVPKGHNFKCDVTTTATSYFFYFN